MCVVASMSPIVFRCITRVSSGFDLAREDGPVGVPPPLAYLTPVRFPTRVHCQLGRESRVRPGLCRHAAAASCLPLCLRINQIDEVRHAIRRSSVLYNECDCATISLLCAPCGVSAGSSRQYDALSNLFVSAIGVTRFHALYPQRQRHFKGL